MIQQGQIACSVTWSAESGISLEYTIPRNVSSSNVQFTTRSFIHNYLTIVPVVTSCLLGLFLKCFGHRAVPLSANLDVNKELCPVAMTFLVLP